MRVQVTSDPVEFKATAFPFLQRDPVLNTVFLSNVEDRLNGITVDPEPPAFVSVHKGNEVVGAVLCLAQRGIYLWRHYCWMSSGSSHGYASALTADVTRRILAAGSAACLLTDLANPTSNKIYAAIGYRPVMDFVLYELDPAVGSGDLD